MKNVAIKKDFDGLNGGRGEGGGRGVVEKKKTEWY